MAEPPDISVIHPVLVEILESEQCSAGNRPDLDPTAIDTLFVMVFYGRSGTTLMAQLIDSHPHVLSLTNCEFRSFFSFFETVAGKSAEEQLVWFLELYGHNVDDSEEHGHRFVTLADGAASHVPADIHYSATRKESGQPPKLVDLLSSFLSQVAHFRGAPGEVSLSAREFFLLFHAAYMTACGLPPGKDARAVFWNMHVPDPNTLERIAPLFDQVRVIHSIRRPTQTLGSHFKRYFEPSPTKHPAGEMETERAAAHVVKMLLSHDRRLSHRPDVDEFAVRLEDLHNNPEETTGRLAARLGIPWHDTLMEATHFGTPYVYQARDRVIRTFDPRNLENQHLDVFEARDLILLENLLAENYRRWGYDFLTQSFPDDIRENGLKMLALDPLKMEQLCWDRARFEGVSDDRIEQASTFMRALLYNRIEEPPELFDLL